MPKKTLLRRIHLWFALAIGLPVALISATGLPISYWYQSDALFFPDYYRALEASASQVSFDELASSARSVSGVTKLDSLYLVPRFHTAQAAVRLIDGSSREVSLDLSSGRVIGVRDLDQTAMSWIYGFHTRLLLDRMGAERTGKACVFALAVCLVALAITGLWLWWPIRFSCAMFSPIVRRRTFWPDLHLKLGLYALPILVVVALTAVLLTLDATRRLGSRQSTAYVPDLAHNLSSPIPRASLQVLAERGRLQSVAFHVAGLFGIDAPAPIAVLNSDGQGDENYWVSVDRATGCPTGVSASNPFASGQDAAFLIGIHQGHRWGAWGQRVFAAASCIPLILYVSGLIMWIKRPVRGQR